MSKNWLEIPSFLARNDKLFLMENMPIADSTF